MRLRSASPLLTSLVRTRRRRKLLTAHLYMVSRRTASPLMGSHPMPSPLTGSRLMASPLMASPLMASPLMASPHTGSLLMASPHTGSLHMDSNRPHPKDHHAVPEGFVQRQPSWSLRRLRWRAPALAASCPRPASQLIRPRGRPRPRAGLGAAVTPEVASLSAAAPGATPASCPSRSATAERFGSSGSGSSGSGSSGSGSSEGAGGPSDVAAIASKVSPAVVDVNVTFNYQDAQGAGTGIVLTSNGLVLTNNHVVDGATKVSVTDVGNGKTYPATVLGYDKTHDVALIKLQGASNLQTAKLASSGASVGQAVVAIGNAGGTGGTPTSAGGSITALGQSITANDELSGGSEQLSGLIETNANIEAGDSGGPLVNVAGEVLGMDTAASQSFTFSAQGNQGFAIPISEAWTIAKSIEANKGSSTTHVGPTAFIGLQISPNGSSSFGFGSGTGSGSGAWPKPVHNQRP